MDINSIE
jgi:hypothetical protein